MAPNEMPDCITATDNGGYDDWPLEQRAFHSQGNSTASREELQELISDLWKAYCWQESRVRSAASIMEDLADEARRSCYADQFPSLTEALAEADAFAITAKEPID